MRRTKRTAEQRAYQVRELDHLIQEVSKLLTSLTNYASGCYHTPAMTQIAIRQFEIIAVDQMNFVIVVTGFVRVKNKMVRTVAGLQDEAELLTYVLSNQTLTGLLHLEHHSRAIRHCAPRAAD